MKMSQITGRGIPVDPKFFPRLGVGHSNRQGGGRQVPRVQVEPWHTQRPGFEHESMGRGAKAPSVPNQQWPDCCHSQQLVVPHTVVSPKKRPAHRVRAFLFIIFIAI